MHIFTFIATSVEGIFRLSGSEKRIKELKTVFDSPDRYGKGLVWDGYTVHDAANVLRRYLNDLPEPVVPLDLYEKFRGPLRGATKQAVGDADGPQFVEHFNEAVAIDRYQRLITELPPLNRQLLLYLLDLLAVFAAKADENRMNSQNLAAIFQPGMLSHPSHDMSPEEYRLNQCVIIFLIENQDNFLIGMQGTGTDEKTVQEIESGAVGTVLVTTPSNHESGLGRSSSNASAGAQSVRRDGQLRRNRSVTSRHSKGNDNTTPNSPALTPTPTSGGLGRSNTVPSKKSPAIAGGKFKRNEYMANVPSPTLLEPLTPAIPETPRLSEQSNLSPEMGGVTTSGSIAGRSQEKLLGIPQDHLATPQKDRHIQNIFQRSPIDETKRSPNKLKKRRIPGSLNASAQSSNTSLAQHGPLTPPNVDVVPNPMDQAVLQEADKVYQSTINAEPDLSSDPTPHGSQVPLSDNNLHPHNDALKASKSPPASVHSVYNDGSDLEHGGESHTTGSGEPVERERKSRWKIGRAKDDHLDSVALASSDSLGRLDGNADKSTASLGVASQKQHKPSIGDNGDYYPPPGSDQPSSYESGKEGREEAKGPIGWIRNKMREAKETAEQRRTKSPPAPTHGHGPATGGKSLDLRRDPAEKMPQKQADRHVESVPNIIEEPTEKPGGQPATEIASETLQEAPVELPAAAAAPISLVEQPANQLIQEPALPVQPEQPMRDEPATTDTSSVPESTKP